MRSRLPLHLIVYRLSALGDVAMTIPAVYSCAKTWPQVTFHIVTTDFCAQLFVEAPANVSIHPVEKRMGLWKILSILNKIEADAVADFHNVLRSWIVDVWFLMRGKRVCMLTKNRLKRKALFRKAKCDTTPFTQRYFDVFARLGLSCTPCFKTVFKTLPPIPLNMKKAEERWIGIAPFARYKNKTYPLDKMQQVVCLLAKQSSTRIFLFGGRGEQADILAGWERFSPCVHSVAGCFSLAEELSLMAHLDVMLSMDSANQHMASLVDTRAVTIWGSTTPACGFMGWNQKETDAVYLNLVCQPCTVGGSNICYKKTLDCLEKLKYQDIIRQINRKA